MPILFLCTANRIRSPLAEALWQREAAPIAAESAGTWTKADLPAHPAALQVAEEMGLNLANHRSRRVEDVRLEEYELILTMERGQRDALRAEYYQHARRIFTLAERASGYAYDVVDPEGHTVPATRATAHELEKLIRALRGKMDVA